MRLLLLLLLILMSPIVKADGNRLLNSCQSAEKFLDNDDTRDGVGAGFCIGLIQGVRSSMQIFNDVLEPKYHTCWPNGGIDNGQAIRVVLKFLRSNPEILK